MSLFWIIPKAKASSDDAIIGTIVFMAGFILIFTASTLYHAYSDPYTKWLMRKADHISIFFMIAGSYTPFILIFYKVEAGLTLLSIMWGLTFLGTIFKAFTTGKYNLISTAIYVAMGISILWVSDSFFPLLPQKVTTLIYMGGAYYLIGVVFYLRKSWKYHHPVWHLFVLAGAASHWWALWYSLTIES